MQHENVYWDWGLMQQDLRQPSILAIGDSWFWYPFPGGSLLNQLGNLVEARGHTILAYGNNGAEAFDYVHGVYAKRIKGALRLHGDSLSAVLISGGGNDFAGLSDLRPLLLKDCSACTTAKSCFRPSEEDESLGWLMDKITDSYTVLIDQIIGATWNTTQNATGPTKVYLHNYDYALASGLGVFGAGSVPWLLEALQIAKVPPELRDPCIRHLIDQFALRLQGLAARYPDRVRLVDSRGTLTADDWANELHPKPAGFKKIAQRWLATFQQEGLAPS